MAIYILPVIEIIFSLAVGALLQRRYLAYVLAPASFFVSVSIAAVCVVYSAGVWASILTIVFGLSGLQFGYLVGLAAPHFLRGPISSHESHSPFSYGPGSSCYRGPPRPPTSDELPDGFRPLAAPRGFNVVSGEAGVALEPERRDVEN